MDNQIKNLLNIIKYSPPLLIVITCFFVILFIYNEEKKEFIKEKELIETQFIQDEKRRIETKVNTVYNYIQAKKYKFEDEVKVDIQNKINTVHKIAMNIYKKNKDKKNKNQIISQIKDALETMRFNNGRGYFSIHTLDGVNILHPINREFEGSSVFNRKDSLGKYSVQEAISIAKTKGEGFFSWYYYKPDNKSQEFKKIGIVKKFEPYNLIFTTAEYVDDFKNAMQKIVLDNINGLNHKNDDYIYVVDFKGNIIYHPLKKVINHNIFQEEKFSHVGDSYKKLIAKKGEDIGEFIYVKPKVTEGKNTKETKITFVKRFDSWNWMISSSFRLTQANHIIEKRKKLLEEKYKNYKENVLIYGLLFTILLLIISFYLSKLLEEKFLDYKLNLEKQIKRNKNQKETLEKAQKIAKIGEYELNLDNKVAYWSDNIVDIFGVKDCTDIPGPNFLKKIMFDEDWHYFETSISKCIKQNVEHFCRYRVKRPEDGKTVWVECRGKLSKNNKLLGTVQDITQSKLLEIENHRKEELLYQQSKMASMGEMLGNIAHQWRQPLSAISTAATGSKAQKEYDCLSDEQFNLAMDKINSSAQYLSQTIDDFRDFFNPKDKQELEFEISNTISKALNLVDAQFIAKEIDIIQDIKNYKLLSLENELIQVLINILNNARDALLLNEEQKRLIFIKTYEKADSLFIEIYDNAGGIKENIIDRIFEPYFSTKHKSVGTGIGLYMSEEIMKKHLKGKLLVSNYTYVYEDIDYTGAKFIIQIPKS